ncbi:hypothetical protein DPMN_003106 [Dreissena polymorpha]|uniref:Uncharacterized protein n=1 Tax=Dreissena polymorpha TaxID=45954 RepID=A0A9D4MP17_DREPO|nr:hypothetical protein DPMN_003106 [Dreissena polymorpha]
MARQRPTWLVMGLCIVEIERIVIREVRYQLDVNRCRNEEIIVKGNFGWAWLMWAGHPRVGNGANNKVQYQFEDIRSSLRCTQNFQGSSVGGESGQDGRTDGWTEDADNHNIPTFSLKSFTPRHFQDMAPDTKVPDGRTAGRTMPKQYPSASGGG